MQKKSYNKNIEELLLRAQNGDNKARNLIAEENIGLVHSSVRRFYGRGFETEDLFQIGCIGLLKAIQKFDTSFNVKFSTYAVPMIMGEIKRFIRDDGIIKVSRSIKELAIKALALRETVIKETNTEPTVQELSDRLGVSPEDIAIALDAELKPESIYAVYKDGDKDNKPLAERLIGRENCEDKVLDRIMIEELLAELEPREQKIIILRYFKQKTQSQIAKQLGISQVQVSRIEKKILSVMRDKFTS